MSGVGDYLKAAAVTGAVVGNQLAGPVMEQAHIDPAVSEPIAGLFQAGAEMAEAQADAERLRDESVSEAYQESDYAEHADPPEMPAAEFTVDIGASGEVQGPDDAYETAENTTDAYEAEDVSDARADAYEAGELSVGDAYESADTSAGMEGAAQ